MTRSHNSAPSRLSSSTPRELQHTLGHVNCTACDDIGKCALEEADAKVLPFPQAADSWFKEKVQSVRPGTVGHYADCIRALKLFFGAMHLRDIHIGHIIEYRRERQAARMVIGADGKERHVSVGPSHINQEVSTLKQILDRAGLWVPIAKHYKPMPLPRSGVGQRLEREELQYFFEVAERRPRWKIAYLVALASVNTAAGPGEIMSLRLGDLRWHDPEGPKLQIVECTKTGQRVRNIPMTEDCAFALGELERMAHEKGATDANHYLLPHRAHEKGAGWDPTQHQGHFRKSWAGLCREAAKKYPRLLNIPRYALRHTAITYMAEDPNVDRPTLEKLVGHGSGSRMIPDVYFHASVRRKKVAVQSLNGLRGASAAPPVAEKPQRKDPQPAPAVDLLKTPVQSDYLN